MASVISLEGVSKRYRIFSSRKDRVKRVLTLGRGKVGRDFWALQDLDLEVEPGTAMGILGRNGAGKSTLLSLISGVTQPTSGMIRVRGRLVALLQLGAGFSGDFTGRENIMLNGLILGIERKEMLKRLDEIEAFADIGDFVDQPLKTYSSGMRARLGFAVAVNVEPDILLVDEALSTGDAAFKTKGIKKMRELRDSGVTILFVSHSTTQVRNFCNEAVLIHKGRLVSRGDTGEVVDHYQELLSRAKEKHRNPLNLEKVSDYGPATPELKENPALEDKSRRSGTGDARIENIEILDAEGRPVAVVSPESELTVRLQVRYAKDVEDSAVGVSLRNEDDLDIFATSTALEKVPIGSRRADERMVVDFTFQVPLRNGRYSVSTILSQRGAKNFYLDRVEEAATFDVSRPPDRGAFEGLVHLPTRVEVLNLDRIRE